MRVAGFCAQGPRCGERGLRAVKQINRLSHGGYMAPFDAQREGAARPF